VLRDQYSQKREKPLLTLAQARGNHQRTDWDTLPVPVPWFVGRRIISDQRLEELVPFIDWTFFFSAWELKGRYPAIFENPTYGTAARELYDNAQVILKRIMADRLFQARAVYGFWAANSDGDDIVVYKDDARKEELTRFHMLRQQEPKADDQPNRSLADFIAPVGSLVPDYIGAFAVTTGIGVDALVKEFEAKHDDYSAIIAKAIADRLAEAFAESLHKTVREEWGFGKQEMLSLDDMVAEKYRGIRPAFGYPACPDHSEKTTLFNLLGAPNLGINLTENFAMTPAASVSGIYFSHPDAKYFSVGRIGRDQLDDYAKRKGISVEQAERWLAPNL
jgi:5-methyltetrahydrofolate--homocysteine methyltransferase